MIKTYFYLKTDKKNSKGESAIYVKIKLQDKTSTLSSGKYINKDRWEATNKLKNTLRNVSEKNCQNALKLIETKIESIYFDLIKMDKNVTLNKIKNELKGKQDKSNYIDVLKLFQVHNDYFKKRYENGERTKASLQKYNRAKDLLANFLKKM